MSLLGLFDRTLIGCAQRPALEYEGATGTITTLTFGDLESRSTQLAHVLQARGVARGDRVAG